MQDFFPSMALKPNPACEEVVCHQRQREYQVLIFFLYEKSYPQTFELLKVASFKFLPLGYKLCWNAPPKCQMWSSARGLPSKGMLKLWSDRRFFELFLTVLELLLLHCRVCLYELLLYLCYSCWVRGGVNNWSCCNKLTLCQQQNIQRWCIPITAHA